MKKFIGVIAVAMLIVAFSAPASASAGPVCSNETAFSQPQGKPRPYTMRFKGFQRRIVAKGSVAAAFTGTCRGFVSGKVTIAIRNPNGSKLRRSLPFENLEFKNGYVGEGVEDGRRFKWRFGLVYKRPIVPGTCFTITVRWEPWRFNTNELVAGNQPKVIRDSGCYAVTSSTRETVRG